MKLLQWICVPKKSGRKREDGEGSPSSRFKIVLLAVAQAQLLNDCLVRGYIFAAQVNQESAALTYQLEQPPARRFVVLVAAQVLGQLQNALGEQCNLHLGRPGVTLVAVIFTNYRFFYFFC